VDTLHQPFFNELHIMTGLAESYLTLPSDDVALPRTAVRDELGHIFSLKPETGFGSKKILIITMRAVTRASYWQWCDRHMRHTNSGAEQNGVLYRMVFCSASVPEQTAPTDGLLSGCCPTAILFGVLLGCRLQRRPPCPRHASGRPAPQSWGAPIQQ